MKNFPYRDRERSPNYISWFIKRENIFKVSLLIAFILNLDKIILGTFSLIQVFDTFDGGIPFAVSCAKNILKYGITAQIPNTLCGISSFTYAIFPLFVLTQLATPPYTNYLFHSIFSIFIAFLGMFLFLRDEFNWAEEQNSHPDSIRSLKSRGFMASG
jgi:hypothetical protein